MSKWGWSNPPDMATWGDFTDNSVFVENTVVNLVWDAPTDTAFSIRLYQAETVDGNATNNFQYILQSVINRTDYSWRVSLDSGLKLSTSNVFMLATYKEGSSPVQATSHYFNITGSDSDSTTTAGATATTGTATISATATTTSNPDATGTSSSSSSSSSSGGLSTGAKIGIGVAIPVAVLLGLAAAFLFFYRRRKARSLPTNQQPAEMQAEGYNGGYDGGAYHNDAAIAAGKAKPPVYGGGVVGGPGSEAYSGTPMTENRSELYSSMDGTPNTPSYEMYSPQPGHPQTNQQHYELYTPGPGERN